MAAGCPSVWHVCGRPCAPKTELQDLTLERSALRREPVARASVVCCHSPMAQHLSEWFRRSSFSSASKIRLGAPAELWDSDPTHYEGWSELRDRLVALGRKPTRRMLAYYLSDHLLDDVLVAAGGVENAIGQLRSAIAELERWVAEQGIRATPGIPYGLGHDASTAAWYAFADVISWARALEERLDRRPVDKKKFPRQGLLPAIKPKRLKKRVTALVESLRRGPVGETRPLANFTLHAAMVRHPYSGASLEPSGAVSLPIPDTPPHGVANWYLFTWIDNRDGVAFAEKLWLSVQDFIEALLTAFEKAVPRRLR